MSGALVKVDKRHHRQIAQENWGLTDEQMKGMHVHHRIPRSQGGTNDPSNLFVCSPSYHYYVWHGANARLSIIEQATINAKKGAKKGGYASRDMGVGIHAMDHSAKAKRMWLEGRAWHQQNPEAAREASRKAGKVSGDLHRERKTGVCAIPPEEHSKRMAQTNKQKWVCDICGDYVGNAKNVNRHIRTCHPDQSIQKSKVKTCMSIESKKL